jgi:hypothetical protein
MSIAADTPSFRLGGEERIRSQNSVSSIQNPESRIQNPGDRSEETGVRGEE